MTDHDISASGVLNPAFVSMAETPESGVKAVAHKCTSVNRHRVYILILICARIGTSHATIPENQAKRHHLGYLAVSGKNKSSDHDVPARQVSEKSAGSCLIPSQISFTSVSLQYK